MPKKELPRFELAVEGAEGVLAMDELSECHGLVCGLLSAAPDTDEARFRVALRQSELLASSAPLVDELMDGLLRISRDQLDDAEMGFELWLPDDNETLGNRTRCLAQWCSGYLTGLAEIHGARLADLSEQVSEVIQDLSQISTANVEGGDDDAEEDALMEITEYVRVGVLLIREELRTPDKQDTIH